MTPDDFIRTWSGNPLSERASAQSHFRDLCTLLGIDPPSPLTAGAFEFEKGAAKTTGGDGWADVWLKDAFAWEYKKTKANLDAAYAQVQRYAPALDHPPLLIVSDTQAIVLRTAFTGAVQERHDIAIDDLRDAATRDLLRRAFEDPSSFRPRKTRADLTEDAAATFADLALRLRQSGHDAGEVAHFVNRLVFCMFAEDVRLLPEKMFQKMVELSDPASFEENCRDLFRAMATKGGKIGYTPIPWFNGGLFDDETVLPVTADDIGMLRKAAKMDWSQIDASLLGTLFERGLDPDKRSQLGAHYTDAAKIMQIVEPVVLRPLKAEWEAARAAIEAALQEEREAKAEAARTRAAAKAGAQTRRANRAHETAVKAHLGFLERLRAVRVLDPACGSGNFLNLALTALKDLEHRANLDAEALGLPRPAPQVGPECVLGIELNPYAAELARVSTWIAEIQWMRRNGFEASKDPILKPLGTIECRDAVLGPDGAPADWPEAEFIIGNPPFLGSHLMRGELGDEYVDLLRSTYSPRLAGNVNLCVYWFDQVEAAIKAGRTMSWGLVATNAIRQRDNRKVLARLFDCSTPLEVYSHEEWVLEGADVVVSLISGTTKSQGPTILDGKIAASVSANLMSSEKIDFTAAEAIAENIGASFFGYELAGEFDISGPEAREMLLHPNPHGRLSTEVLSPMISGRDVVGRQRDRWLINFSRIEEELEASFFEVPFERVIEKVKPGREINRRASRKKYWWKFGETRPAMRRALAGKASFIVTPERSKHRFFKLVDATVAPDRRLVVFPRDDFAFFGLLSSRHHVSWALTMGSRLTDRPGYNTGVCFETFPFPEGLTPDIPAQEYETDPRAQAIAAAARDLDEKREAWLNPPDLIRREPEVVAGYPDRILPHNDAAEKALKKRTLTNLYNARPAWLAGLHERLDAAVADAYGWPADLSEEDALARLLELNRARAAR